MQVLMREDDHKCVIVIGFVFLRVMDIRHLCKLRNDFPFVRSAFHLYSSVGFFCLFCDAEMKH